MEVNIIFQNESKINENNSFDVEFKNEQEIIEVFFNQKRDYYLTNAIAFIKNKVNISKELKELESIAKKHINEEKYKVYNTITPAILEINYNQNPKKMEEDFFSKPIDEQDATLMRLYKKNINM